MPTSPSSCPHRYDFAMGDYRNGNVPFVCLDCRKTLNVDENKQKKLYRKILKSINRWKSLEIKRNMIIQ